MKMISAVVLAAGKSKRMGQAKLFLPWGNTTVIGKVIDELVKAGVDHLYVVVGSNKEELPALLSGYSIEYIFNPEYANDEMIISVKMGLSKIHDESTAALIVLGDQPQIEANIIRSIVDSYKLTGKKIVVPSFQMHRGHPWLIDRSLWEEIYNLETGKTLRDYLKQNQDNILYIETNSSCILQDLDTPEDYKLAYLKRKV